MLERHNSKGILYRQPSLRNINKHSCLQRQKSRKSFVRQQTLSVLGHLTDVNNNDSVNTCGNDADVISLKVRRLLLKHTKLGFIQSFANLSIGTSTEVYNNNNNNTPKRIPSESDRLVRDCQMPDSVFREPEIASKTINKEEFELGRVLGSGGFGSVYLGVYKKQKVAIKVMHKYMKNPAAQIESFRAELHVMRFNHANIVKTLAATHIDKCNEGAWVVMEYIGSGSLHAVLNDPEEIIHSKRRLKYAIQIASALAYAHKNKVAHLDLKPQNILITEDDNCKVGDFGCSQKVEFDTGIVSPTNRSILTGTFAYRAPELLKGEAPTFKADLYSYGITLWQLRSRETPFSSQNQHVVIFGVVAKGLRPPNINPDEADPFELSYKDMYTQCWVANPLDRPTAQEVVDVLTIWKNHM
ncbi:serine/threonine-protein kinase mos-like [Mya arenaria]|uniref:serine/threonine-protein kinase mos-like n=1 Tax=Mya arenaria TaxID=6604 RepID=UPI0022E1148D|nr:serine/threonine-protein kinase mos-like [Mya arenaria]